MGNVKTITNDHFPEQSKYVGTEVFVCFNYNTDLQQKAKVLRDDKEPPHETIFLLENGWVVRAAECQYSFKVNL